MSENPSSGGSGGRSKPVVMRSFAELAAHVGLAVDADDEAAIKAAEPSPDEPASDEGSGTFRRLTERAIRQRWPIKHEARHAIANGLVRTALSDGKGGRERKSERARQSAARIVGSMEKENARDERHRLDALIELKKIELAERRMRIAEQQAGLIGTDELTIKYEFDEDYFGGPITERQDDQAPEAASPSNGSVEPSGAMEGGDLRPEMGKNGSGHPSGGNGSRS